MKISRRMLAASAVATATALAQTPATPAADSDEELLKAAREQARRNGEAMAKFTLPMATEPAFQFKP